MQDSQLRLEIEKPFLKIKVTVGFEACWVLFLLVFARIWNISKKNSQDSKDRVVGMVIGCLSQYGSCSQWTDISCWVCRLSRSGAGMNNHW